MNSRDCADMIPPIGDQNPGPLRSREKHLDVDLKMLFKGVLNPRSFLESYLIPERVELGPARLLSNPVELRVHSGQKLAKMGGKLIGPYLDDHGQERAHWEFGGKKADFNDPQFDAALKQIRRSHNLRVTMGRDQWQRGLMFGNIAANAQSYTGATGAATATSATSLTNTGAAFPTTGGPNTGLQGQVVVSAAAGVPGVFGVILSNTATVLTIDQWWNVASATAAAGTTPTATAEYIVLPWNSFANWIGLSTNSSAAAAGDVTRTADGLYADGTTSGTATEQSTNGLSRVYVQPTFPGAGQIQLQYTWTYTGSSSVAIAKACLFNTKAAAGTLLVLETLTSATATVNANGDTIQLTWTINL